VELLQKASTRKKATDECSVSIWRKGPADVAHPGGVASLASAQNSTVFAVLLRVCSSAVSVYQVATQDTPGVDLYPENVPITLTFSASKKLTIYAPNDASGVNPTNAYIISKTPSSINLDLPPKVLLIKIVGDS
jgi:hypothetical protein